jgi:hypothetical protein
MEKLMPDITTVLGEELVALTISLFGLSGLRFVLGAYAALSDGTFVLSSVGAFIRSTVLGRVFPILTVAYFAAATGGVAGTALTATSAALGAAFVAETIGSIQEALSASTKAEVAEKIITGDATGNPVPQD